MKKHEDNLQSLKKGRFEGEAGMLIWPEYDYSVICSNSIVGPQPMWRANLHQKHGMFIEEWKVAGDYEFFLRCAGENNYYHVPAFFGVYNAHTDGVELSNPIANHEEASSAIMSNQNPYGVGFVPIGNEMYQVKLGAAYAIVEKTAIYDILEK